MLPDQNIRCPATGFAKTCRSIVSKYTCPKWVHIQGKNPQNGQDMDHFGCVDTYLPMLLIENSQQQRQTGAAVESFRNEVVRRHEEATQYPALNRRNGDTLLIEGRNQ